MHKAILIWLSLAIAPLAAQELDIKPVGDYTVVVNHPPVLLEVSEGFDVYLWRAPDALKIKSEGNVCQISGPEGKYTVECIAVLWKIDYDLKTKEVITKTAAMTFVIGEVDDDPDPAPPPIPTPGERFVIIIDEIQDRDVQTSVLMSSLRAHMDKTDHTLMIMDKDAKDKDGDPPEWLVPYLAKSKDKGLPYVFIVTNAGELVHEASLPKGLEEVKTLIEEFSK